MTAIKALRLSWANIEADRAAGYFQAAAAMVKAGHTDCRKDRRRLLWLIGRGCGKSKAARRELRAAFNLPTRTTYQ